MEPGRSIFRDEKQVCFVARTAPDVGGLTFVGRPICRQDVVEESLEVVLRLAGN